MANKFISIKSQECHTSEFFTHALSRSKNPKKKKKLFVKFAHRIDGKGHIDRVTKVVDLYTPSNAGSHSQSAEFVVLKVIFSDVAIATNKEPIIEEKVEDDAVVIDLVWQARGNPTAHHVCSQNVLSSLKLPARLAKHCARAHE